MGESQNRTHELAAGDRLLARLAGVALVLIALFVWFFGTLASQEGWDDFNGLSLALASLAALGFLAAAVLSFIYAGSGKHAKAIGLVLTIDVVLVALWFLGTSTWCSHCGIP